MRNIFPSGDPKIVTLGEVLRELEPVDMNDVCQASFSPRYMSRNRQRDSDDVSFTIPAMAKQVPLSPDSEEWNLRILINLDLLAHIDV